MQIPDYFATKRMETAGVPRIPAGISDTGAGLEAEAMAGAGRGMQRGGDYLAVIEGEKQRNRDNATLAKLRGDMDDFEFAEETAIEKIAFSDLKEFDKLEKGYDKRWDKKSQELLKGQNRRVQEHFRNYTQLHKDRARRNYHSRVWPKEQSFGQGEGLSLYNKALRKGNLKTALFALNSHAQYFPPEELQRLKDKAPHDIEWYAGLNLANNNPQAFLDYKDEEGFFENLNPAEKIRLANQAESELAGRQRQANAALKEQQEQVANQMLLDLWQNKLQVEQVEQALDKNLITSTRAKSLRKTLLSKEPRETDLLKLAEVKDAILAVGLGRKTRKQALDVLYKNVANLNDKTAEKALNDIYAATLKDDNFWTNESRIYMEEQIREKDPLTGLFTDDATEIALTAQSKLILDKTIEDAEAEGKPLSGRDILIKSHEIMLPLRRQAAELRKKKIVPETIGEGLEEAPFITEADLDKAEKQARKNLGEGATKQQIKAEMLRLLGE